MNNTGLENNTGNTSDNRPLRVVELREYFALYRGDKEYMPGKALAERFGFDYTVIAPNFLGPGDQTVSGDKHTKIQSEDIPGTSENYRVITLPALRLRSPVIPSRPLNVLRKKPDIIVSSGLGLSPKSITGLIMSRLLKVPLVYLDAGDKVIHYSTRLQRLVSPLKGLYCRRADAIITYNELHKDTLAEDFGVKREKIHVVPKGINLDEFYPDCSPGSFKTDFGIPEGFSVLYVNRLVAYKAPDIVVQVAKRVAEMGINDISFIIVGDGDLKPSLERYCKNHGMINVFFTGALPHDKVKSAYAAADAVLYTYPPPDSIIWVGFPTVIAEAMGMGKAIIYTGKGYEGSTPLRQLENGILTAPGDVDEIVDYLIKLYNDPPLREKLGRAARQYAEECMDWYAQADAYYDIFADLSQ